MKIGFYIHHTSLKAGGIFTYSIGILKLIINSDEIEKVHLIISADQKEYFNKIFNSTKIEYRIVNRKNFIVNTLFAVSYLLSNTVALFRNRFKKHNHLKFLSRISLRINPYSKHISPSQIDLLHVPFQYSPIYNSDVPVIITMHDIQEYHYPEYFSSFQKLHRKINNINAMNESNHIIVSFDHIKNDLLKHFSIDESKISICPPPFAEEWFLSENFTKKETLSEKYGLSKNFLLYPAATWQHKNHINLIRAVAKLNEDDFELNLICTGNKTDYYKIIEEEIGKLNLKNNIKFLGIVSEEDLIGLYKAASLVVIPTLYEAGSGPLYEAMRYSAPVICSDVTSLPETMGNDKFIFNPDNVDEMTSLTRKMLTENEFRNENLENSRRRMEELQAENYTDRFLDVYKNII